MKNIEIHSPDDDDVYHFGTLVTAVFLDTPTVKATFKVLPQA